MTQPDSRCIIFLHPQLRLIQSNETSCLGGDFRINDNSRFGKLRESFEGKFVSEKTEINKHICFLLESI